jgi:signal transduction histidine kinase/ActR/RegA family two-component response regulator
MERRPSIDKSELPAPAPRRRPRTAPLREQRELWEQGEQDDAARGEGAAPAQRHRAGDHLCLIFDGAAEQDACLGRFLAGGLAGGERCLLFGPASLRRRALRALRHQGLAVQPEADRGALVLTAASLVTRALAAGDRALLVDHLGEQERQAIAGGFSGLRVSWEVPHLGSRLDDLVALEAELGRALAGGRTTLLCQYARSSDPFVLHGVLRTHPRAMLGGKVGPNGFFEPPEIVLGVGGAQAEVDWMIGELRRAQAGEQQLGEMTRILAQKRSELEQAGRAREELLGKLAHELRNPLSTVSNALQVLRMRAGEEVRHRALTAAERQVFHQAQLVDELLDASQIVQGELELRREPFDLARLVAETVERHRQALSAAEPAIELELPSGPLPIHGDRLRLSQALSHLLANAVKFSAGLSGSRSVTVRAAALADGRAEITVADRGPGIRPDLLPHVFEIFTQEAQSLDRASGGLGMGLAIVKGLIELHGGEVQARNRQGAGVEIKLMLPLARTAANANAPGVAENGAHRVLVVEDNADTAMTLCDFLELSGFEVAVAGSGREGVEAARRFRPDVVLCDLGLPEMNGFEVAVALRRDPVTASTRLIAVTGYGRDEDRRRSRAAGFDLHLTKPVDPVELRRLLREPPQRTPPPPEVRRTA